MITVHITARRIVISGHATPVACACVSSLVQTLDVLYPGIVSPPREDGGYRVFRFAAKGKGHHAKVYNHIVKYMGELAEQRPRSIRVTR